MYVTVLERKHIRNGNVHAVAKETHTVPVSVCLTSRAMHFGPGWDIAITPNMVVAACGNHTVQYKVVEAHEKTTQESVSV